MGKEYARNRSSSNDIGTCKCLYECDGNGDESLSQINRKCNVDCGNWTMQ
ncbi:hypothetical protein Goklo_013182 [Gossypium klotzschianum]|uniref:Uncharacterized protein n=1 Tax=Gossypium klotzschianum TaxID=34286 RepID=A0A7J8U468_9ROSI|nr:hypothetical protein [Gossypium klotzschianum]